MKMKLLSMKIYIIALILLIGSTAIAANIVYPKTNNVTINSPRTFFIGNEKPHTKLSINGENVDIHKSGGFWHTVTLHDGENIFKIENGKETKTYTIFKNPSNADKNSTKPKLQEYAQSKIIETNKDNVPLRATPVDFGINRLQHFQKGIQLKAVGEIAGFYKIALSSNNFAYIAKNDACLTNIKNINLKRILDYTYTEDTTKREFKLKLDNKTPYTLIENNGLDLTVYNINNLPNNEYKLHIDTEYSLFGYTSKFNKDNELVLEVFKIPTTNKSKPFSNIKITIDAGHGGNEYGAIGCLGTKEKDINLTIAKNLKNKLQKSGAKVIMTRENDSYVSLSDRVKISNEANSQIFISLHNNALPDSLANQKRTGTEVYYFYPQSEKLAEYILEGITTKANTKDNGIKQQSFAVIRNTQTPSILIELTYIINPEDNSKLINKSFQNSLADGIVKGLEKYLNDIQKQ